MYFTLKTKNKEEQETTNKILEELKQVFGSENVETDAVELWVAIRINASAWITLDDICYDGKSHLHIFKYTDSQKLEYDILLENCDTIYCI